MAVNSREACDGGLWGDIIAPTLGAIIGGGIYRAPAVPMPSAGGDSPDEAARE